jgi:hypothetical protein
MAIHQLLDKSFDELKSNFDEIAQTGILFGLTL